MPSTPWQVANLDAFELQGGDVRALKAGQQSPSLGMRHAKPGACKPSKRGVKWIPSRFLAGSGGLWGFV